MRVFEMAICDDEDYWIEDICGYLKAFMSEEDVELHVSKCQCIQEWILL